MANKLLKRDMKKVLVVSYDSIRSELKTGDLFFSSGSYLFSGFIQRLTKSAWSHVAIVYVDKDLGRVLVLEAEPMIGIRLIPLSKYLKDYQGKKKSYKGQVFIASLNNDLDQYALNEGISFGLDELTRPYDNWEIFRIMMRILFKIGKPERNRQYICSELVRACFKKSGVDFKLNDSYISPDAIWTDKRVDMRYRIL
jgi:uncharacterized protein YycO